MVEGQFACATEDDTRSALIDALRAVLNDRESHIGGKTDLFDEIGISSLQFILLLDRLSRDFHVDLGGIDGRSLDQVRSLDDLEALVRAFGVGK